MPRANPWTARAGPRGLGRLQQLTHGARAFLRNLRYPPPRQARGADTTLRVRIIRACPAPLSTWTWRLMRKPENGGGIATVVSARTCTAGPRPTNRCARTGSRRTRIRREPPARRRAGPRHCARRADMACPRAVMAALRLELPSCMAAAAPGPARRAATTSARTATARTRSRPARVARQAEGTRPSWPALLAFLRRPGSSQPGLPIRAEQGGKLVSPIRARRRPDEIGLRRAGRHDGPGIRIARPRRSGAPFGARRACTVKLKGSPAWTARYGGTRAARAGRLPPLGHAVGIRQRIARPGHRSQPAKACTQRQKSCCEVRRWRVRVAQTRGRRAGAIERDAPTHCVLAKIAADPSIAAQGVEGLRVDCRPTAVRPQPRRAAAS